MSRVVSRVGQQHLVVDDALVGLRANHHGHMPKLIVVLDEIEEAPLRELESAAVCAGAASMIGKPGWKIHESIILRTGSRDAASSASHRSPVSVLAN